VAGAATGAFTEAALGVYLTQLITARLGAAAATAALPFLPEIAIAVGAVAVGIIVATLTKILVQATADYLNQSDRIFEIATAGAADGTVTIGDETTPIEDGIREGVENFGDTILIKYPRCWESSG
jgi:hypothetical protein